MNIRNKLAIGLIAGTVAFTAPIAPRIVGKPGLVEPAYAQPARKYSTQMNPFEADGGIKALAKKAKSGSDLESAQKLHQLLQVGKPGGLRQEDSGKTLKDDRQPRTAAETLKQGGDCSEFAYAVDAALGELGIGNGAIVVNISGNLYHVLAYAEIGGARHIIDPQTAEFGKGTIALPGGKRQSFTYAQAKKSKRIAMELEGGEAQSLFHMEQGNYLKSIKGKEQEAIAALKRALELFSGNTFAQRKLAEVQARYVTALVNAGMKSLKAKRYDDAIGLFGKALDNFPEALKEKNKEQLEQVRELKKQAEALKKESE